MSRVGEKIRMGIFGKAVNAEQEMKKVDGEAISSIIDKQMTLKGEISFQGQGAH